MSDVKKITTLEDFKITLEKAEKLLDKIKKLIIFENENKQIIPQTITIPEFSNIRKFFLLVSEIFQEISDSHNISKFISLVSKLNYYYKTINLSKKYKSTKSVLVLVDKCYISIQDIIHKSLNMFIEEKKILELMYIDIYYLGDTEIKKNEKLKVYIDNLKQKFLDSNNVINIKKFISFINNSGKELLEKDVNIEKKIDEYKENFNELMEKCENDMMMKLSICFHYLNIYILDKKQNNFLTYVLNYSYNTIYQNLVDPNDKKKYWIFFLGIFSEEAYDLFENKDIYDVKKITELKSLSDYGYFIEEKYKTIKDDIVKHNRTLFLRVSDTKQLEKYNISTYNTRGTKLRLTNTLIDELNGIEKNVDELYIVCVLYKGTSTSEKNDYQIGFSGKIEDNEDDIQALIREGKEELCMDLSNITPTKIGTYNIFNIQNEKIPFITSNMLSENKKKAEIKQNPDGKKTAYGLPILTDKNIQILWKAINDSNEKIYFAEKGIDKILFINFSKLKEIFLKFNLTVTTLEFKKKSKKRSRKSKKKSNKTRRNK